MSFSQKNLHDSVSSQHSRCVPELPVLSTLHPTNAQEYELQVPVEQAKLPPQA